ncbi:butyrophilin subfamily 2 member A1-like [Pundamilia nyererei]|uniref:Butyrophilin subfamily 2 member A1-like n=1 Tax=Pundamilia nyererei TaxID=303518 RepID=A0A3B4GJJ8_9CICH|nr:PREDICTED: butyrophilin subfamily 2 member A1-like [Pundamilia nyererei]
MDEVNKVCFDACLNRSLWFVRLLLLAAVLSSSCCTGKPSAIVVPKIVAFAGETVLLPCNITPSGDVPTVEWTKESSLPDIAFLYRDGCETFEMKNPVFRYRTNLIRHELHNGNLSMVISNLQISDSGKYHCAIIRKKKKVITTLELFVGAVSEPKLSVVPGVGGGLTLQCEAKCWFPEPKITFLDNQGNEISADDPKRDEESSRCFTVKGRVSLQTATNRVTCRVHQPEIHQTRDSEIYLPDGYQGSFTVTIVITVLTTLTATVICSCIVHLVKKHSCPVRRQKRSLDNHGTNDERQSPVIQTSDCTNDSKSSSSISNPTIPPSPKSHHNNDNPRPEALTTSVSSSQTTEEDSSHLDTSGEMKRNSDNSSSLPVLSIPHERLRRSSTRRSVRGSIRVQHRNIISEDSEPLMEIGPETK